MSTINSRFNDPTFDEIRHGTSNLALGSSGPAVLLAQELLRDMGFLVAKGLDGLFGTQTHKAVLNLQRHLSSLESGLPVTGVFDARTLALVEPLAPGLEARGQRSNFPAPIFEGQRVRVVVVKYEHRTFLFNAAGELDRIFLNAVGAAASETDTGLKKVASKMEQGEVERFGQKTWNSPKVFGPRLLNLSWADGKHSGEELHGTSAPGDLGEHVSHGCVRHHNDDIVTLFDALKYW